MRVRLKGLNYKTKRLSDGTLKTYYWAWRGGPALPGKPGDPQFMAAYNEAIKQRVNRASSATLLTVLNDFQHSGEFEKLAPTTKGDYVRLIKQIEADFADLPLDALADKRTRGDFLDWRDRLSKRSQRQADYAWTVLARCLSWAKNRGKVTINPCEKGGRLYDGSRADIIWTPAQEKAFLDSAPAHLRLAFMLAIWTGQRKGDLLRLTWDAYDGKRISLVQSKTGVRVVIPVGKPLKALLEAARGTEGLVLRTGKKNTAWTEDGFHTSWTKACDKAGIKGVTFNDLRGTAVTRLALAGATEPEIATITGHSLKQVRSILDKHYLHR
jgi:integrase